MKAKSTVRDIDPQNDLTFLRIRSKKHEIMVAPGNNSFLPEKPTTGCHAGGSEFFLITAARHPSNRISVTEKTAQGSMFFPQIF